MVDSNFQETILMHMLSIVSEPMNIKKLHLEFLS